MCKKKKILLDCDPGYDDAVAILLAWGNPNIDLLGITTVAGNQTLEKVTRNALGIAQMANIQNVPIIAGCSRPLIKEIQTTLVHGESGLDGPKLPEVNIPLDPRHAVDFIIDTVMSHPDHTITLVPTGALTNIAMAVRKEPKIVDRVKEIVLMGGGYHTGNITPVAEFNIYFDPEAAQIVFNESWNITMIGLDVTHQALATPEVIKRVQSLNTQIGNFLADILLHFKASYAQYHGFPSPPVHDPCTIAYVINPDIMKVRKAPINIELHGKYTYGMTVTDLRHSPDILCHTQVATHLEEELFWDLIVQSVQNISEDTSEVKKH